MTLQKTEGAYEWLKSDKDKYDRQRHCHGNRHFETKFCYKIQMNNTY